MIKVGIVGEPNVGKSSFFKLISNMEVTIENFPFSTINPNIAIVNFHDENLKQLQPIYNAQKIIYEQAKFYDIAGLVKGASEGVGLGNNFLATIHEVDIICHVVRCFPRSNQDNACASVSAVDSYEIINLELILHDLKVLKICLKKHTKQLSKSPSPMIKLIVSALEKAQIMLEKNIYLNSELCSFNHDEQRELRKFGFLTLKPCLVLANISENQIKTFAYENEFTVLKHTITKNNMLWKALPIRFILDLQSLSKSDYDLYTDEYQCQIDILNIDNIIMLFFKLLEISFFFTCGNVEVRAWAYSLKKPDIKTAVGKIHSSFTENFIMAQVVSYKSVLNNSAQIVDIEKQFQRCENKKYVVCYGDIINVLLRN